MLSSVKPVSGSLTGQHMNTQKMLKASWSVVQDNRGRFCWRAHSDKLSCVDFLRIDGSGRCNVGDSIVTVWLNGQRAESHWVLEGIVYADQVKEKGLENWEGAAEVMGHAGPTCHPLMLEHEIPHMINDVSSPDNTLLTYNKPLHVTTHGSLDMSISGLLHHDKSHIRLTYYSVFLTCCLVQMQIHLLLTLSCALPMLASIFE